MASVNTVRKNNDDDNDLYRTSPVATKSALLAGVFDGVESAWDCCDGIGGISNILEESGIKMFRSDLIDYGMRDVVISDFLALEKPLFEADCIVMNPPYKLTSEFMDKACSLSNKVIMFNRVSFLETVTRAKKMQSGEWPLTDIFFHAFRVGCAKGLTEEKYANAVFYAWYVFDKEKRANTNNPPLVHWITDGKFL